MSTNIETLTPEQRRDLATWLRVRAEAALEATVTFQADPSDTNMRAVVFYAGSVVRIAEAYVVTSATHQAAAVQRVLL